MCVCVCVCDMCVCVCVMCVCVCVCVYKQGLKLNNILNISCPEKIQEF